MSLSPDAPVIPEAVARYFANAVKAAACRVYSRWGSVYDLNELHSEAWVIAMQRWQMWSDQERGAKYDLYLRLSDWVHKDLASKGWKRVRTEDGKRRWVPPVSGPEVPRDPQTPGLDGHSAPWAEDQGDDIQLGLDWRPMARSERHRFARVLMREHPVLVTEFLTLGDAVKPSNLSHAEWSRRQEAKRAKLRLKYATELATARYAVEGYVSEDQKAAA
jgi:hypothetical protein